MILYTSRLDIKVLLILATASSFLVCSAETAAWPQFRGPNSSGVAEGASPPLEFSQTQTTFESLYRMVVGRHYATLVGVYVYQLGYMHQTQLIR